MKVISDIAIGGLVIGTLLLPLISLRWLPQILGRFFGPKAKLATLVLGMALLVFMVSSFLSDHQTICSDEDKEFACEISWVLIPAVLCGWALMSLVQIRFVWSTVSAVWSKKISEA